MNLTYIQTIYYADKGQMDLCILIYFEKMRHFIHRVPLFGTPCLCSSFKTADPTLVQLYISMTSSIAAAVMTSLSL